MVNVMFAYMYVKSRQGDDGGRGVDEARVVPHAEARTDLGALVGRTGGALRTSVFVFVL